MVSKKSSKKYILSLAVMLVLGIFSSCDNSSQKRIVIWTSCAEFAQYTELFNKTHPGSNAVIVYKENPANELPPAKDELAPDIVVGSWLRTEKTGKYFETLDYLFDRQLLSSGMFYEQLLDSGKSKKTQYLLPVSFNLPAIIFSKDNSSFVKDNYTLTLEQLKTASASFNEKNKKGNFTKMGFVPSTSNDFLYLTTKLYGVDFKEEKNQIVWNNYRLQNAVDFDKKWVVENNESADAEHNFAYKYLFMPDYRQVTSGRTLFAYTTSDSLFKNMRDQELNIDFRWISGGDFIPIEDSFTMMGIYKKSQNQPGATEFITWFFDSENQKQILEHKVELNLTNERFGIADGFSSIRDVTEHVLPSYYEELLTNLPPSQMLKVPQCLPAKWNSYKSVVVEPYLSTAVTTEDTVSIGEYEAEWNKKVFDN